MSNLNNDNKKFLESFTEPSFTEHDFIAYLFSLLYKNGVYQISEEQLAKKLYFYYKNRNYSELFQDIALTNSSIENGIDIHDAVYQEKFFSGNVFWSSVNPEILNLRYPQDIDLSYFEKKLSIDGINKIKKIAEELSIQKKVEQQSKNPIYIYGKNPNTEYTLVYGKKYNDLLGFELLTDGEISSVQYFEEKDEDKLFRESPSSPKEYIILNDNITASVSLKNANFAIKRGLYNGQIRYSILNTEILDSGLLEEIMNAANKEYEHDEFVVNDRKPYVRKLVLK